jgi:hypothetical protein
MDQYTATGYGFSSRVVIFLFDKSGSLHHPNLYRLDAGNITRAISWTERNAEYSFSFTAEVKHM